jgi:GNAT superfamily N-acetyltransferase
MTDYAIEDRFPTPGEHRSLMNAVGWQDHIDDDVLARSLDGSLRGAVATFDGTAVGMARLVGDGTHYFYVQDVVVHPEHSDEGLGSRLTQRLIDWVDNTIGEGAFIGLFASPEAESLYESLGFVTTDMTGMHRQL